MLERYTNTLAIIFALIIFLDLPTYLQAIIATNPPPKIIFFAMFAASIPVFVARSAATLRWLVTPFGIWVFALIFLNLVHLLGTLDPSTPPEISTRIQMLGFMLAISFVMAQARPQVLHASLPWIGLLVVSLVIVDFIAPDRILPRPPDPDTGLPIEASEMIARAAGTLINPNKAGESMALLLLLSMPLTRRPMGWFLTIAVCIAVLTTVSRSSIAAVALVVAGSFMLGTLSRFLVLLLAAVVAAILLMPMFLVDHLVNSNLGAFNVGHLLERFNSIVSGDFSDASGSERFVVLSEGWRLFIENPFTGAGAAATTFWNMPVSVHNQAVLMLAEYGLIGGLLWLAMLALPFARAMRGDRDFGQAALASMLLLLLSLATHNMLDFCYWLASIALFASGWPLSRHKVSAATRAPRAAIDHRSAIRSN